MQQTNLSYFFLMASDSGSSPILRSVSQAIACKRFAEYVCWDSAPSPGPLAWRTRESMGQWPVSQTPKYEMRHLQTGQDKHCQLHLSEGGEGRGARGAKWQHLARAGGVMGLSTYVSNEGCIVWKNLKTTIYLSKSQNVLCYQARASVDGVRDERSSRVRQVAPLFCLCPHGIAAMQPQQF